MIINTKIEDWEFTEINKRLADKYGKSLENLPTYRLVWSDDEFENRRITHTGGGIELPYPKVELVPKYRQWVQHKYILERLTILNEFVETDLIEKLSYEPLYVFEDRHGNALKPVWSALHFIIENVIQCMNSIGYTKYKDPEADPEEAKHIKETRIKQLEEDLFGNESEVGDALAHKDGITVPRNYQS